jgi:histone-lysine N-methyltransferase SETD3
MVRLLPSKARIIISKYTIIAVFIGLLQNAVLVSGFFGEFPSMTRPKIASWASTGIFMIENGGGGAGSDADWAKALRDNEGDDPSLFEQELLSLTKKNSQLSSGAFLKNKKTNLSPKLKANQNLLTWLEENGDVYLKDQSNWGSAPHPLAVSTETVDEITNESTGRGLLARRSINEGDELISIPLRLCMTINSAREALGNKLISSGTNEYLAIAVHLIYEKFVLKEKSFWKPYLDVLPLSVEEVNPTFTWSDEDLAFLEGSPVVAATRSLQTKLGREYEAMKAKLKKYGGVIPEFPEESFSLQNWIWAFTILFSRAIRLQSVKEGETLALVPYADFINHSPFSTAYIDARESGSWLLKDGDQEVILYADRGYRKMEQVRTCTE